VSFELSISGADILISKSLQLSDIGEGKTEINFSFEASAGKKYTFDLDYQCMPHTPSSYQASLNVTLTDEEGNKLGCLSFTSKGVQSLKKIGVLGFVVDVLEKPVNIEFSFQKDKKGNLDISSLDDEVFFQDTRAPKLDLNVILPVILATTEKGVRSQTHRLRCHPYSINYTLTNIGEGLVQFQHTLYQLVDGNEHLLERIYFQVDSLETLREVLYASMYFHENDGVFKLLFYPANMHQI